jgi:DNA-3-methyladenine glycosylase I
MSSTVVGADGEARCRWCAAAPEFFEYHDKEWGYPVSDDIRLFEKLCLESFQSGLSWRTILAKRGNFRVAFHGFDFEEIVKYKQKVKDEGIVRHRGKIEAVINNAQRAVEFVFEEGSLAAYFWSFEPDDVNEIEPNRPPLQKNQLL